MRAPTVPARPGLAALAGLLAGFLGYPLLRIDALFSASGYGTAGCWYGRYSSV